MAKSLAQEEFEVKHAKELEIATRELMRRSHDLIRVYNPLDHTFSFMYDRFWNRVPAKSYKDIERYLALKFFKNIAEFMIGQQITKQGEELKALREKQMGKQFLDHYEENVQIWDRVPKVNDPDLLKEIKKVVIVGVVEEYGLYEEPQEVREAQKPMDARSIHEQLFDDIGLASNTPEVSKKPLKPLEEIVPVKKEDLAKEVIA